MGRYAAIECSHRGCQAEVTLVTSHADAAQYARIEGWDVDGPALCPDHRRADL